MIHELPWLPAPSPADRAELARKDADRGFGEVARLRALAGRGWNEGELRSLARRLRRALETAGDWRERARAEGYTPFFLLIVSSSTASHLVDALTASALRSGILLESRVVEYEEPETWLASHSAELSAQPPDATLLALDRKTLHLSAAAGDESDAAACIDAAVARVNAIAARFAAATGRRIIIQTLPLDATDPQSSMEAWLPGAPRRLIHEFNARLVQSARVRNDVVFDVAALADAVGTGAWHAGRYWFVAKLPFAPECIPFYAYRLVQLLAAMLGKSRRVLILDLDETLWGGVIGDDGIQGIVLGAGNARGEAHLAIQRMALQYKERGVILCVASKNTDEIAREVFRRHPDMLLREPDIALFEINWGDKASNIKAMAETLELGYESFVFIDDNPVERKQVRDLLPGVAIPELPRDPSGWVPVIQGAAYFEQTSFSAEDRARTEFYRGNAQRRVHAQSMGDPRAFLESLQMVLNVTPFDPIGRARIAQLIAKSNQFNLTTRRYSESEVAAMESAPEIETMQCRLADIFGDNGMISVVICRKHPEYWDIDTWIMSCRVLGRGVEQKLLGLLASRARAAGARELRGLYLPTARNGIVREHYSKLGFAQSAAGENGATHWRLELADFEPADVPIALGDTTMATAPTDQES